MVKTKFAEKMKQWFEGLASYLFFGLPKDAVRLREKAAEIKEKVLVSFTARQKNPRIPKTLLMQTALKSYRHYEQALVGKYKESITILDADRVRCIFDQLQLPIPYNTNEFSAGCDGILIPLDAYGVMLRVEVKDQYTALSGDYRRINNSPWIIKPIASIDAGKFIVEICPGGYCEFENVDYSGFLRQQLAKDGHAFADNSLRNVGRLPLYSPDFPHGQPVVTDRLATVFCKSVEKKLQALMPRFNPQDILYGDLRDKFQQAWPDHEKSADPHKIRQFWRACVEAKAEGRLITGWKEAKVYAASSRPSSGFADEVAASMAVVGKMYDKRLDQVKPRRP